MKPILIAIVGPSGSGKTSLSFYLRDMLNIPTVCSYTTRPMREDEENGVDHIFVSRKDYRDCMRQSDEAKDEYDPNYVMAYTKFGGEHYWATRIQFLNPIMTYVIDEKGLLEFVHNWGQEFHIVYVQVNRESITVPAIRQERDKDRLTLTTIVPDIILDNNSTLEKFFARAVFQLGGKIAHLLDYGCS